MAEAVVDQLEIVEVDEQHGDRPLRAVGSRQRDLQVLLEHEPVGQVGEGVVIRQVGNARLSLGKSLLRSVAGGDVGDDALHQHPAVRGAPRVTPIPDPAGDSVGADQAHLDVRRVPLEKALVERVVALPVFRMDGGLPRHLLVRARWQRPHQGLQTGADEGVADVAPVGEVLHLVDVHAGGGRDPAQHVGGGKHLGHREIWDRIWFRHGESGSGAC